MVFNVNAVCLTLRGVIKFFASKLGSYSSASLLDLDHCHQ